MFCCFPPTWSLQRLRKSQAQTERERETVMCVTVSLSQLFFLSSTPPPPTRPTTFGFRISSISICSFTGKEYVFRQRCGSARGNLARYCPVILKACVFDHQYSTSTILMLEKKSSCSKSVERAFITEEVKHLTFSLMLLEMFAR